MSAFPGGFLGVDVFFALSGYLITDLLAAQWNRHGHLGLRGFWMRRARRLLPALAVLLVVTTATAAIEPAQLAALRETLLAAVTYSSNWWQALAHHSYFAQFAPPPPLQHLWSPAIEEQFYLVWPLLLTLILKLCPSGGAGRPWPGSARPRPPWPWSRSTSPVQTRPGSTTAPTCTRRPCSSARRWR